MNKKVLVISSSPRKGGNSDTLCDEFIRGAQESGNTAEKIYLKDKNIAFCTGCGVCNSTHSCVIDDDMKDLLPKMTDSDVIVLASPVYFYSICGQLKTFIDRCVPEYTDISDKDFYYILTAADNNKAMFGKAVETLRGFTIDCLPGVAEKGIVYGTGAWKIGEINGSSAMKQAYEFGKKV
jgi:multimeric flavodoxin WrbA